MRRGTFNFERVTWKYFKDETARLEGFKAGEIRSDFNGTQFNDTNKKFAAVGQKVIFYGT